MYHWLNIRTGEVVETFWDMVKTEILDLVHYRVIGIWKFSIKGF